MSSLRRAVAAAAKAASGSGPAFRAFRDIERANSALVASTSAPSVPSAWALPATYSVATHRRPSSPGQGSSLPGSSAPPQHASTLRMSAASGCRPLEASPAGVQGRTLFGSSKHKPAERIRDPHSVQSPGVKAGGQDFSFITDVIDRVPAPYSWSPHSFTRAYRDPQTEPPRYEITEQELMRNLKLDPSNPGPWHKKKPHSLELEQYFYRPRADLSDQHWAAKVRRAFNFGWLPGTREKELLHRGAVSVHKAVVYQALDRRLYDALDLPYKMRYHHPLLCLHMWFIVRRFMGEGQQAKEFVQNVYNLWLSDVEYRLQDTGAKWRFKKWMKILESQFFAASLHYDEALSDRRRFDLPMALWYHVFLEDTDGKKAPWLESFILFQLKSIHMTPLQALYDGRFRFSEAGLEQYGQFELTREMFAEGLFEG